MTPETRYEIVKSQDFLSDTVVYQYYIRGDDRRRHLVRRLETLNKMKHGFDTHYNLNGVCSLETRYENDIEIGPRREWLESKDDNEDEDLST